MDTYRVWFKSGGAILIAAAHHTQACVKATYQSRAAEKVNGTKRGSDDWKKYTLVTKTENLTCPTSKKWSVSEVQDALFEHVSLQREYEDAIQD